MAMYWKLGTGDFVEKEVVSEDDRDCGPYRRRRRGL